MKWIDVMDIAIGLVDNYPTVDPITVNFVQLREYVMQLPGFDDHPDRCGERILEAIQQAWIEEKD